MTLKLFAIPALCLVFTGCELNEMVDSQILQQVREYFPMAELSHPKPDMLVIQTHLANLTEKFAEETTATILQRKCCHGGGIGGLAQGDLDAVLPAVGIVNLAIDYEEAGCVWAPSIPQIIVCQTKPFSPDQWHRYTLNAPTFQIQIPRFAIPRLR